MDLKKKAYFAVIIAVCTSVSAQDTNAPPVTFNIESTRPKTPTGFKDIYMSYVEQESSISAFDSISWSSDPNWIIRSETDGYAVISEWNSAGQSVMKHSFLDAGREMAAHSEIVDEWRNWDGWKGWFAWLFVGTIGNTAEERLSPTSPVATASQISWWQARREDESLFIAPHFLDMRPYLYQSSVWKRHSGKPILFEDLRLRYVPSDSMRVEEETIIPLTASWQVAVGASGNPMLIGRTDSDSKITLSLSRIFSIDQAWSFGYVFNDTGKNYWQFAFHRKF
jgi:hypothetical protein